MVSGRPSLRAKNTKLDPRARSPELLKPVDPAAPEALNSKP